jgi:hypothetical protein
MNERTVGRLEQLKENEYGVKTMYKRIWVPGYAEIKIKILDEAHKTSYSVHPGGTKMFQDLRKEYWWPNTKFDVTRYVSKCLTYLQVKAEHQKPYGRIQHLDIPEWK